MTSDITWYDVLGVLPGALPDEIAEAWQARKDALLPGAFKGAPPKVLSVADRARKAVDEAWSVLADRRREAVIQPPKPPIPAADAVLEHAAEREAVD